MLKAGVPRDEEEGVLEGGGPVVTMDPAKMWELIHHCPSIESMQITRDLRNDATL